MQHFGGNIGLRSGDTAPAAYDLVRPEADFPAFDGTPTRSILVCTERRSGSTLFCEAIAFAGGLGRPVEYFQPVFNTPLVARWGEDTATYVRAVRRFRTDPSGVFSSKLFWPCLTGLAAALGNFGADVPADAASNRALYSFVAGVFPNPQFVFLTRRDKIGQAISLSVAAQTGRWRGRPRASDNRSGPPDYDFDMIVQAIATFQATDARWSTFFRVNGIDPIRVVYEDLAADYDGTLRRLFEVLGRPDATIVPPRIVRQSGAHSEDLRRRFLAEFASRAGRGASAALKSVACDVTSN